MGEMEHVKVTRPKKCTSCRGKEFVREGNEVFCKKCGLIIEDYNYE